MAQSQEVITLNIKGMTCQSCVKSINKALSGEPGILKIVISLEKDIGIFTIDSNIIKNTELIVEKLGECGFDASFQKSEDSGNSVEILIPIEGMDSFNADIEAVFKGFAGVLDVDINMENENTLFSFNKLVTSKEQIIESIEGAGLIVPGAIGESLDNCSVAHVYVQNLETQKEAFSIKESVEKLEGVFSVRVQLQSKSCIVKHSLNIINVNDLISSINDLGFLCSLKAVGKALHLLSKFVKYLVYFFLFLLKATLKFFR